MREFRTSGSVGALGGQPPRATQPRGAAMPASREQRVSASTRIVTWKRSPALPGSSSPASALSATIPSASARRGAMLTSFPSAVGGTCSSAASRACSTTAPTFGVSRARSTTMPSSSTRVLGVRRASRTLTDSMACRQRCGRRRGAGRGIDVAATRRE